MKSGTVNVSKTELCLVPYENGFEPLGFIKKPFINQQYQFVHLILTKFFASVHLLFNHNSQDTINNERLRNYLPFISGFVHRNKNSFLRLISKLKKPNTTQLFGLF